MRQDRREDCRLTPNHPHLQRGNNHPLQLLQPDLYRSHARRFLYQSIETPADRHVQIAVQFAACRHCCRH